MEISLIIPCFNAEAWITVALESVFMQGLFDFEVIVIDDGSTDKSATIVEKQFPKARLIRTENAGPSKARNLGTELSSGEFIQYLDADDMLAANKIKLQLELLKNSGADVSYGNWQKLFQGQRGQYEKGEYIKKELRSPEIDLFTDFWCPPAVYLFRRSIVERVGRWNEGLPIIQDARFVLDCALKGARFVYCDALMAYYRLSSNKSVSRKDIVGFNRDCLRNAQEIEQWWQNHGGITKERKQALLEVYGYVARASFEHDRETFEAAYGILQNLQPGYKPSNPKLLKIASALFGYKNAEFVSLKYRRLKRVSLRFLRG